MKKTLVFILFLLSVSICLNIFQYRNAFVRCENIDVKWKAELLYWLGHKSLDGDKDGVPCENLLP